MSKRMNAFQSPLIDLLEGDGQEFDVISKALFISIYI